MFHCEIVGDFLNDWTLALIAWLTAVIAAAAALIAAETGAAATAALVAAAASSLATALFILIVLLAILFLVEGGGNAPAQSQGAMQGTVASQQIPGPDGLIDTDPRGYSVAIADLIVLAGLHVFDTGHHRDDPNQKACWHELHPVIAITKVDVKSYLAAPGVTAKPTKYFDPWCVQLRNWAQGLAETDQAASALEHPAIG